MNRRLFLKLGLSSGSLIFIGQAALAQYMPFGFWRKQSTSPTGGQQGGGASSTSFTAAISDHVIGSMPIGG